MTAHFEINCTYTATSIPAEIIPNSFTQASQPAQNKTVKKNFQKHLELHWQAKRFVYMRRVRKRERWNFERARDVERCHQKRQSFIFFCALITQVLLNALAFECCLSIFSAASEPIWLADAAFCWDFQCEHQGADWKQFLCLFLVFKRLENKQ